MKENTEKWIVTFNNGNKAVLRIETETVFKEAELFRPVGIESLRWRGLWPVGSSYTDAEFVATVEQDRQEQSEREEKNNAARKEAEAETNKRACEFAYGQGKGDVRSNLVAETRRLFLIDSLNNPSAFEQFEKISSLDDMLTYLLGFPNAFDEAYDENDEFAVAAKALAAEDSKDRN